MRCPNCGLDFEAIIRVEDIPQIAVRPIVIQGYDHPLESHWYDTGEHDPMTRRDRESFRWLPWD